MPVTLKTTPKKKSKSKSTRHTTRYISFAGFENLYEKHKEQYTKFEWKQMAGDFLKNKKVVVNHVSYLYDPTEDEHLEEFIDVNLDQVQEAVAQCYFGKSVDNAITEEWPPNIEHVLSKHFQETPANKNPSLNVKSKFIRAKALDKIIKRFAVEFPIEFKYLSKPVQSNIELFGYDLDTEECKETPTNEKMFRKFVKEYRDQGRVVFSNFNGTPKRKSAKK